MSNKKKQQAEKVFQLGVQALNQGDYQQAHNSMNVVLKNNANHAQANYLSGVLKLQMNRADAAIALLKKATYLTPKHLHAHYNLALAFQLTGKYSQAIEEYNNALSIDAHHASSAVNLAAILTLNNRHTEAKHQLELIIQHHPSNCDAHINLGFVYIALHDYEQAKKQCEIVNQMAPHQNKHNALYAFLCFANGQFAESKTYFEKEWANTHLGFNSVLHYAKVIGIHREYDTLLTQLSELATPMAHHTGVSVTKMLAAWLSEHWQSTKNQQAFNAAAQSLNQSPAPVLEPSQSVFVRAYGRYLIGLAKAYVAAPDLYLPQVHAKARHQHIVYCLGDSHSLSYNHLIVQHPTTRWQCRTQLMMGIKAWHFSAPKNTTYRQLFEAHINTIPSQSVVVLSVGEIDCRLDEGVITSLEKTQRTLAQAISDTIDGALNYLVPFVENKALSLFIQNVPHASNYQKYPASELATLTNMITCWNETLNNKLRRLDLVAGSVQVLDVAALHETKEYHLDKVHLQPRVVWQALEGVLSGAFFAAK